MKRNRILYLALTLLMLFSTVAGCGGTTPAESPAASTAAASEAAASESPASDAPALPRPKGYDVVSEL